MRRSPLAASLLRFLYVVDGMSNLDKAEVQSVLHSSLTSEAVLALLAPEEHRQLTGKQACSLFDWLEELAWGERAGRSLVVWWKDEPEVAWPVVKAWVEKINNLEGAQRDVALEGVIQLASFAEQHEAAEIIEKLRPIALAPVDPYSEAPVEQAQRTMASLMAEFPALAVALADEKVDDAQTPARKQVLLQALGLRGPLTVEDYLGKLASALATNLEDLRSSIREADDMYSAAEPLKEPVPPPRPSSWIIYPFIALLFGLFFIVILVAGATKCTPELAADMPVALGAACSSELPEGVPRSLLPVLLPLLGIVAAIHVLAIDLASGRFPRKGASTVALAPGFVAAYAFLAGSMLFQLTVGYLLLDERDEGLFTAGGFIVGLLSLILVIWEVLRSQDPRLVARRIAARHRGVAKAAGRSLAKLMNSQSEWARQRLTFRWVKYGMSVPTRQRGAVHEAPHRGFIAYDLRGLRRLDEHLDRLNEAGRMSGPRKREAILLKTPGAEAAIGEVVSVALTDDPAELEELERGLRRAVKISRNHKTIELQGAVQALATLLQSAVREGDLGTAREIGAFLTLIVEWVLEAIDRNRVDPDPSLGSSEHGEPSPTLPEVQAVLALERALRSVLDQQDEFAKEVVKNVMLDLASAARYRSSSYALETCALRAEITAKDYLATSEVIALVELLRGLGQIAYATRRTNAQAACLGAVERLYDMLSSDVNRVGEASYCVERYTEMLAIALRYDYLAHRRVLKGARKLSEILRSQQTTEIKRVAQIGLLQMGSAAFEAARYSLALSIADIILTAGLDMTGARRLVSHEGVSASLQIRTALVGEAFGRDVEASVKRYADWVQSLPHSFTSGAS